MSLKLNQPTILSFWPTQFYCVDWIQVQYPMPRVLRMMQFPNFFLQIFLHFLPFTGWDRKLKVNFQSQPWITIASGAILLHLIWIPVLFVTLNKFSFFFTYFILLDLKFTETVNYTSVE